MHWHEGQPPSLRLHLGKASEEAKKSRSPWIEVKWPQNPLAKYFPDIVPSQLCGANGFPSQSWLGNLPDCRAAMLQESTWKKQSKVPLCPCFKHCSNTWWQKKQVLNFSHIKSNPTCSSNNLIHTQSISSTCLRTSCKATSNLLSFSQVAPHMKKLLCFVDPLDNRHVHE